MNNEVTVVSKEDKPMEYTPFGSQDKIKLTVAIVQNLICVKTKSGKTCSSNDAIKFMMMCQARRLNPFELDAYLIGYDGREGPTFSLITAHQAFLKRAEVNPEYDGMKSGIIVKEDEQLKDLEGDFYSDGQKVVGGWATVYFKNRKQAMHKRVRLERFQKAFGVWQDDAAGMICKCAEADALRSSFPTMLGGLYIKEESPQLQAVPEVSAPIFKTPEPEPTVVKDEKPKVEKAPVKSAAPVMETNPRVDAVMDKLKEEGIKESQLFEFLHELGVADLNTKTVEDLAKKSPDVMELLEAQWLDMVSRIKGK